MTITFKFNDLQLSGLDYVTANHNAKANTALAEGESRDDFTPAEYIANLMESATIHYHDLKVTAEANSLDLIGKYKTLSPADQAAVAADILAKANA
tara:strand:- start:336 stop:623 length:288 start_codon:yes stop_codon:yes gene_type:complete